MTASPSRSPAPFWGQPLTRLEPSCRYTYTTHSKPPQQQHTATTQCQSDYMHIGSCLTHRAPSASAKLQAWVHTRRPSLHRPPQPMHTKCHYTHTPTIAPLSLPPPLPPSLTMGTNLSTTWPDLKASPYVPSPILTTCAGVCAGCLRKGGRGGSKVGGVLTVVWYEHKKADCVAGWWGQGTNAHRWQPMLSGAAVPAQHHVSQIHYECSSSGVQQPTNQRIIQPASQSVTN